MPHIRPEGHTINWYHPEYYCFTFCLARSVLGRQVSGVRIRYVRYGLSDVFFDFMFVVTVVCVLL